MAIQWPWRRTQLQAPSSQGNALPPAVLAQRVQRIDDLRRRLIEEARPARQGKVSDTDLGNAFTRNRQQLYQELVGAYRLHPWTRAGLSQIGRAILGPGYYFAPVRGMEGRASPENLKRASDYFGDCTRRRWDNIKDYYGPMSKIYITAIMLKLFGQASWETLRNYANEPITFDVVFARVEPNTDEYGNFLNPPWFQYTFGSPPTRQPFNNVDDIVYFVMPDIQGYSTGSSDLEALANVSLPADLNAAVAFLSDIKNTSKLDGLWWANPSVSDTDFDAFVAQIESLYTGPENVGRSFVSVKGEAGFEPFGSRVKDMNWPEGRTFLREEQLAVIGTPSSQLGVTQESQANAREARVLFFENIVRPLQQIMAEVINAQVLVRDLGIDDWQLTFKPPDFTTSTEDANNAVKLVSWGVKTRNEIRSEVYNLPKYQGGDDYLIPLNVQAVNPGAVAPASPDEHAAGPTEVGPDLGLPDESPAHQLPTKPAGTPIQPTYPPDWGHDNEPKPPNANAMGQYPDAGRPSREEAIYPAEARKDLRRYRKKARKSAEPFEFKSNYIPNDILTFVGLGLSYARTPGEIDAIFDVAESMLVRKLGDS